MDEPCVNQICVQITYVGRAVARMYLCPAQFDQFIKDFRPQVALVWYINTKICNNRHALNQSTFKSLKIQLRFLQVMHEIGR